MRTSNLPFPQDSNGIHAAAATRSRGHSVPGGGRLRITWDAGPPRLVLAGDIDLDTHAALIAALAKAADGTGQVHIDLAGVDFCDVAGMRIILHGGDGQQPAPAQVTVHNLPPHLGKLHRLLNRDAAPGPAAGAAGQGCFPGQEGSPSRYRPYPAAAAARAATGGAQMPDGTFAVEMVQGVPVVAAPAEIDVTNAEGLRAALLNAAANGNGTLVVDMTRTRFCDSSGLHTLIAAHKRAQAEGREVRLVITGPPVLRVFALTGMDRVIPSFTTMAQALAQPAVTPNGRGRQRTEGDALAEDQPARPAASR